MGWLYEQHLLCNLKRNNVARQVARFYCSYYRTLSNLSCCQIAVLERFPTHVKLDSDLVKELQKTRYVYVSVKKIKRPVNVARPLCRAIEEVSSYIILSQAFTSDARLSATTYASAVSWLNVLFCPNTKGLANHGRQTALVYVVALKLASLVKTRLYSD